MTWHQRILRLLAADRVEVLANELVSVARSFSRIGPQVIGQPDAVGLLLDVWRRIALAGGRGSISAERKLCEGLEGVAEV